MKLSIVFVMIFCLGVSASSYSQQERVTLNLNSVGIKTVFKQIKSQTGLNFVYNADQLKGLKKFDVKVQNETVEDVLEGIFKDSKFSFKFVDKVIIISPKQIKIIQSDKKTVKGKVVDEKNRPLPGVAVQVQGTSIGVATDFKGRYTITVKKTDVLRFSFIGYKTKVVMVENKDKVDVQLKPVAEALEEVSVVAFGEQKKESMVSSITTIKAESLKSSSSDLTSSFAGNIAGLIGWQTGGMPGAMTEEEMNTKFYIRGITSFQSNANIDPLILLDGVEVSKLDLARVNPDDIESFNVMKDASATAMYGARGANGVIYVTTKKGKAGDVYVSANYETVISMPTKEIDVVDPITYMRKYNEALSGEGVMFTEEYIRKTASGKYPDYVYPAVDWYDKLFKKSSLNNKMSLSARGGGDKVQYYVSLTHNRDKGMLKTDKLNDFDTNIKNNQTGFLSNITVDMTKTSKLLLNAIVNYDSYKGPYADVREAYYYAFKVSPVSFAPVYPADEKHSWPHIRFGGQENENPYATIQQGYKERKRYSAITKAEYIQNLNSFIKGLELRASVSVNQTGYFTRAYTTTPAYYMLPEYNYDHTTGKHQLIPMNLDKANRTLNINRDKSDGIAQTAMDYQLRLFHTGSWGKHQTSFTVVGAARDLSNNSPSSYLNSLPQRNITLSSRFSYGFNDKYFLETSLGINGSERFASDNKIGYFPSVGGAWILSKENIFRGISSWLYYLKLRISYGKTGNDGIYQKDPRFVHLENIIQYAGISLEDSGVPKQYHLITNYPNEEVTWEIAEQTNFGLDFKLFKGLIDITADAYQEVRHNIFDKRNIIPATTGLFGRPMGNVGKVRSRGLDLAAKVQHAFSPDFWVILNGTLTYNKATYLKVEEASEKPYYQRREGKEISQNIGYIAEGLFQDWDEINNSAHQDGDVRPGDIRYRDINGDNKITVEDAVFIGYPETPRLIYGTNGFLHYKGLELNFAFQGSGNRSFFIDPQQVSPFSGNRALLTAFANDHWSPENQAKHPLWPRLATDNIINHNPEEYHNNPVNNEVRKSTYFMKNGKFLRCTRLELGYYINKKIMKKMGLRSCKIYARANNPFIISDFKIWDIELGNSGFNYPMQKTYSLGVNLSF